MTIEGSSSGPGFSSSTTVHYTGHQAIPLTIDAGARIARYLTLGGYARLAAVLGGETDDSWSVGALLGVAVLPSKRFSPWLALGIGYQSLGASAPFTGLEIVPQLTLPLRIGHFTVGPFAEVRLVDYSADSSVCSSCSGWNGWGAVGIRAGWM